MINYPMLDDSGYKTESSGSNLLLACARMIHRSNVAVGASFREMLNMPLP